MILAEARYNQDSFARGIRGAVRALWSGEWTKEEFQLGLMSVFDQGLTAAWLEGARSVGIEEDEVTSEERAAINNLVWDAYSHTDGWAMSIMANSKANGGKLAPHLTRAQTWVNLYAATVSRARTVAKTNPKLAWNLGATEVHCSSCLKLAGKVKRANYWREKGILPRQPGVPYLECRGYNCDCTLAPTDESLSKGRLPSLP